jgi:cellulose synthase/poly-beta-1,6-N-acetylglucosamine synthase-like glycosyltransferase
LYFVVLSVVSAKSKKKIRDKYTSKDSNMCVILYASGEAGTLEYLIRQLKTQSYDKDRYSIYVFLDKVENPPEYIFHPG